MTTPQTNDHPVFPWLTERRRGYFYRIALALLAAAVVVGALSEGEVQAVAEIVGSLLGIGSAGLAVGHTDLRG